MSVGNKTPKLPNELPAPESGVNLPIQAHGPPNELPHSSGSGPALAPSAQNELPQSNGSRAASGARSGQKAAHSPLPQRPTRGGEPGSEALPADR